LTKSIINPLQEAMRQEHVSLQNVQILQLYDLIKKHLQDLKLEIIHEEKYDNYWSIKAHKGGKGSVIIGNVRGRSNGKWCRQ
jgi:hypothetical protein